MMFAYPTAAYTPIVHLRAEDLRRPSERGNSIIVSDRGSGSDAYVASAGVIGQRINKKAIAGENPLACCRTIRPRATA
jgi:hypothetical protein